jgi:hypothetical protein
MSDEFTILNVLGPYREPREYAFSFDYSVQRPHWPTPQGIRVKVAIDQELDYFKNTILQLSGGTPGQQLRINQILCRAIADQKLALANKEGLFDDRRDVMIDPFINELNHLFGELDSWMQTERERFKKEIRDTVGV